MSESVITQDYRPEEILNYVNVNRGILWERIESFKQDLSDYDEALVHKCGTEQSDERKTCNNRSSAYYFYSNRNSKSIVYA